MKAPGTKVVFKNCSPLCQFIGKYIGQNGPSSLAFQSGTQLAIILSNDEELLRILKKNLILFCDYKIDLSDDNETLKRVSIATPGDTRIEYIWEAS